MWLGEVGSEGHPRVGWCVHNINETSLIKFET